MIGRFVAILGGLLALAAGDRVRAREALTSELRIYSNLYGKSHWLVEQARRDLSSVSE